MNILIDDGVLATCFKPYHVNHKLNIQINLTLGSYIRVNNYYMSLILDIYALHAPYSKYGACKE